MGTTRSGKPVALLLGVLSVWTIGQGHLRATAADPAGGPVESGATTGRPLSELVAELRQAAQRGGTPAAAANQDTPAVSDSLTGSGTCNHCDHCAHGDGGEGLEACCPECNETFWFRADYLLWWTKGSHLPPLVTTSPAGTPREDAGVLDQPGTSVLFGDRYANDGSRSGYRLSAGFWVDSAANLGVAFDYFDVAAQSAAFHAAGDGSPILARPFYNVHAGAPFAELMSFPNVISGSVAVLSRDYFQSTGAWLVCNLVDCKSCDTGCGGDDCCSASNLRGYEIDLVAGYRYYRLRDTLAISEDLTATDPIFHGTTYDIKEGFAAENEFNGAELGFQTDFYRGRWSLGFLTKLAIGNNRQVVTIDGRTVTTLPGLNPVTEEGGLLTAHTNIGRYAHDQFTVIPQLGLELGYRPCDPLRLFAGYSLIYWPHVQRAADQIDMVVDPRNIPPVQPGGTIFPTPQLCSNDFWAQGLNLGLEFCY